MEKVMKQLIVALAGLSCSIAFAGQTPDALAKKVVDGFKKGASVETIEVTEAKPRRFNLTVWYKSAPTVTDARRDTGALVKSVLKELVADGVNPSDEFVIVRVHAGKKDKGVTGKAVAVDFAQSYYDPNADQVKFEIAK